MTLKTGVMMLNNQLCITGIHSILKCIEVENRYFMLCNRFYVFFFCIYDQIIAIPVKFA